MERLTYDFCFNGSHSNQVKGADNLTCSEVCEREESCNECPIARAFDRLAAIEDILGDDYNLDHLRELIEADKAERCVVLPFGGFTDKDGENALKSAMNTCFYYNNPVTRYVADAVAEKLAREEAEAALEKMKEAARE